MLNPDPSKGSGPAICMNPDLNIGSGSCVNPVHGVREPDRGQSSDTVLETEVRHVGVLGQLGRVLRWVRCLTFGLLVY
jgi:hypothetical protein